MSYNYSNAYSRGNYSQRSADSVSNKDQLIEDIPEYGSAFVCGKSRFEEGKFHVRDDPILEIDCGDEHTGVVTERGRVFMFGSNNWGQLGLGHENNVEKPSCVKAVKLEKVKLIACGRNHTLLTTERGNIYSFGCNSDGQLGLSEDSTEPLYSTPQKINSVDTQEWAMISAGSSHSCALTRSGELYVWGSNENGELSLGKVSEQHYPKRVVLDFKVAFISCGYYHTAIISKKGRLYTCGSNEYNQLGHGDDSRRFTEVTSLDEPVTYVSCGGHHTVCVGQSGRVYSFGDGTKGQLGNGEDFQKCKRPEIVTFFRKKKIVQVASGECHTAFVTDQGELYTCGDNRYGKLGLGQKTFNSIQFNPVLVDKFKQLSVNNVSSGGCHMILIGKLAKDKGYNSNEEKSDDSIREKGYSDRRKDTKERSYSPRNSSTKLPSNLRSYDREEPRRINKRNDSESELEEDEMEKTFNRTHTLTRDNKFVPLSELNLKKLVAEEKLKKNPRNKASDNESDEKYNPKSGYTKPTSNINNRYGRPNTNGNYPDYGKNRERTSSNSDSENLYGRKSFLKTIDKKNSFENDYKDSLKIPPYVPAKLSLNNPYETEPKISLQRPNSKPFSKFNAKSFSDDEAPKTSLQLKPAPLSMKREPYRTFRKDSASSEENKPSARSMNMSQRKETRNLVHSNTNLRETPRRNTTATNDKEKEKPKEKPSRLCTIL